MSEFVKRSIVILALLATLVGLTIRLGTDRASAAANATFSVTAPAGAQPLGTQFAVTVDLSGVTFDANSLYWVGYDLELDYDRNVLSVSAVNPTLCPRSDWASPQSDPVVTGCLFQRSTIAAGTLETVTFNCVADGTSALHLPPHFGSTVGSGNGLFNFEGADFNMTRLDASVVCGTGVNGPTATPTIRLTPTATATAAPFVPGSGTLTASGPAAPQPLTVPFGAIVSLSAFAPSASQPEWAGYDMELAYDPSVIAVSSVTPTDLCGGGHFGLPLMAPHIAAGCYGMRNTSTGLLLTISARCLKDGTTPLHFVRDGDPGQMYLTDLFDFNAKPLVLTLEDGSVTCDRTADQDGDACSNTSEMMLGLDPSNRWDFYDVPAPALIAAPSPAGVYRDGAIGASDAQAIFGYFKAGARNGSATYGEDLDLNGVPDGIEYDRSVAGPGKSGPPDGTVSPQDAQLAFAQFKLGYRC